MQIVRDLAGYTLGRSDLLRRAMSKKKEEILLKEKPKFIKRSIDNGYSEEVATKIYDLILKFANYGFNKSHSVAYAVIAYKLAFLKTYFFKYFIANLLTNSIGNESTLKYFAYDNSIRCPLSIIKNVGTSIANDIIRERKKGKFIDFCDFVLRMSSSGVNKKVITSLIEAGSINFGYNKKTLIENLDTVINYADIAKDAGIIEVEKPYIEEQEEYSKNELTEMEVSTIVFYLTEHPVSKYREEYFVNSSNITQYFDKNVKIVVMISNIRETMTKNNDVMAFVLGSDEYGDIDLTIFPNTYKKFNKISKGNVIEVNGKVERRFDKYQVIVNYINILEDK